MRGNKGFTLVEVVVALGLMGILTYFTMHLLQVASRETKKIDEKVILTQDSSVIEKHLLNTIPTGNIRFYSFNNLGIKIRNIIPLPERCADLSLDEKCKEDTSLLYVRYAKNTTPSISVICRLTPLAGDQNPDFIIDLSNEKFGEGEFSSNNFNVTSSTDSALYPNGIVQSSVYSLLAFFSPPFAYMYQVAVNPALYAPIQHSLLETFPSNPEFSPSCTSNLQFTNRSDGSKKFKVDNLYRVKLLPISIGQFTGSSAPSPAINYLGVNDFPARVFNVSLETFGRKNIQDKWVIGVSKCKIDNTGLKCLQPILPHLNAASGLRIDQSFKISLSDTFGIIKSRNKFYEIISVNQTKTCTDPSSDTCIALPLVIDSIDSIPYLALPSETSNKLLVEKFSMLKQEEIKSIRIRYYSKEKLGKNIDIFIP